MMHTLQGKGTPDATGTAGLVGATIGERYLVEAVIGRGGYGTVYRARHVRTDDELAIKVLRASTLDDPAVAERFAREAKLASSLKHPNTLQVIDYGELPDGSPYLVMPFLRGRTLTEVLRDEGPLPPARITHIAMQVLASLAEAHARGVVHRDLKPDNIFLQQIHGKPDHVRVLDFGIAKTLDNESQDLTQSGSVIGTPKYMSPEQAQGRAIDGRSDLFTLGVILFEALSGQAPNVGDTPLATILKRVTQDAPDLRESLLLPAPRGVVDAVVRSLRRDPAERFANADAMAAALQAGLATDMTTRGQESVEAAAPPQESPPVTPPPVKPATPAPRPRLEPRAKAAPQAPQAAPQAPQGAPRPAEPPPAGPAPAATDHSLLWLGGAFLLALGLIGAGVWLWWSERAGEGKDTSATTEASAPDVAPVSQAPAAATAAPPTAPVALPSAPTLAPPAPDSAPSPVANVAPTPTPAAAADVAAPGDPSAPPGNLEPAPQADPEPPDPPAPPDLPDPQAAAPAAPAAALAPRDESAQPATVKPRPRPRPHPAPSRPAARSSRDPARSSRPPAGSR